jgi:hypothetical protein
MPTHRAEIDIERAADDVWTVVGNFADLDWFPGHERLELDGDDRTSWMQGVTPGNVERLIARDEAARTFTYATVGVVGDSRVPRPDGGFFDTATLVGHHQATITVIPTGEASCHVDYDVTVDDNDAMAAAISQGYGRVLASLKAQLEG